MDLKITALAVVLFFVLSPAVLVRLPSTGNKYTVAATHALIFGVLFHLAQTFTNLESFVEGAAVKSKAPVKVPAKPLVKAPVKAPSKGKGK